MKNVFVVIPTLNPDKKVFIPFMNKLTKEFNNVIVVDDGCDKKYESVFKELDKSIIVLKHYINRGKGVAIKTAINYILNNYSNVEAIVTADSDGQHLIKDIKNIANVCISNPDYYILGCRNFKEKQVPKKSMFGNIITRKVMSFFIGLNISDTQTGLRAMSKTVATKLLTVKGDRYEYETNTLIECKNMDIPIKEEKIETVYLNNNVGSHFNPIKDSISIYKIFIKYILSAISSFGIDLLLFVLFCSFLRISNEVFYATILARIISSIYNYLINAKVVFKKMSKVSFIKYIILVIVQMLISAFVVNYLDNNTYINTLLIKIVVDLVIFMVNFIVQREFIFKGGKK